MYTQADRPLRISTPLGEDALLIVGMSGTEAISQPFRFQLDLIAPNDHDITFHDLLAKNVTVELDLPDGGIRYWNGICSRVSRGARDTTFTAYRIELVPELWLLTRRAQSRIFQHLSVPDILASALKGLEVELDLHGTFHPRDFCVQYRETDFNFVSRLMEEEGIFYFFKHRSDGHAMVVANTPNGHPELPGDSALLYETMEGGTRKEDRVHQFEKSQEVRPGKYTLWDHCFELPHKHLEAEQKVIDSVAVGDIAHPLKLDGSDQLEIYDYPGEYAQRFDGVDRGGGSRPADLQKIFEDNKRTVRIRMDEETLPGLVIHGNSTCGQLVSGHRFTLKDHFDADDAYVLTGIAHHASTADYRSGEAGDLDYNNTFTCIPLALPFRPPRVTPKPLVQGTQTAVVVGPGGEEIFTDKYGRVKVQFHWDRQGKNNADSSCWVRVATPWAGKQWGAIHIPRIGQEVIVDFLEGDPDQPIILGSVYNAEQMPPYGLPGNKTQSGIKSRSSLQGTGDNFNEIRFEDSKGKEQVYIHAEKNEDIVVENDKTESVGHDETIVIGNDRTETVHGNETLTVDKDRTRMVHQNESVSVDKNQTITVTLNRTRLVGINEAVAIGVAQEVAVGAMRSLTVGANQTTTIGINHTEAIGKDHSETIGKNHSGQIGDNRSVTIGKEDALKVGKKLLVDVGDQITIQTGKASITMKKDGTIFIQGKDITIKGSGKIDVKADKNITMKGQKILQN